jgi:phosphoglycerate dehydrogenase-like enzyme
METDNPDYQKTSLEDVFENSDIVSIHLAG